MSQHTGSHKNSLKFLGEKYSNESQLPMRRIGLLECISSKRLCHCKEYTPQFSTYLLDLVQLDKFLNNTRTPNTATPFQISG